MVRERAADGLRASGFPFCSAATGKMARVLAAVSPCGASSAGIPSFQQRPGANGDRAIYDSGRSERSVIERGSEARHHAWRNERRQRAGPIKSRRSTVVSHHAYSESKLRASAVSNSRALRSVPIAVRDAA